MLNQRIETNQGDTTMFTTTKLALAAVLVLGAASAALAENDRDEGGGYVLPGSMTGVNPVYHPDLFGKTYGYEATPTWRDDFSQSRKKSHSR
jgi:hypothetical protein